MQADRDIQALTSVFRHLGLSHNDVTLPSGRTVPSECLYARCAVEWDDNTGLATTPFGEFLVTQTGDRAFLVETS